jgi:hydroxymethylglutaryl-CoA lyase
MRWVECPRDSWQGFSQVIPTAEKAAYIKRLLQAGFTHLDLTSFVSPKWVPQHADAEQLMAQLPPPEGREYLVIIANQKGLERALAVPNVTQIAYPLSISPTFQQKNLNQTIEAAWDFLAQMLQSPKQTVVHLSMAFGNPYGDLWSPDLPLEFIEKLRSMGIAEVVLADTYGVASPQTIHQTLSKAVNMFGGSLGAHLHSRPETTLAKVQAVLDSGVIWLEGALGGIGGCPFAGDELVGNLATEQVLPYLKKQGFDLPIDLVVKEAAIAIKNRYA